MWTPPLSKKQLSRAQTIRRTRHYTSFLKDKSSVVLLRRAINVFEESEPTDVPATFRRSYRNCCLPHCLPLFTKPRRAQTFRGSVTHDPSISTEKETNKLESILMRFNQILCDLHIQQQSQREQWPQWLHVMNHIPLCSTQFQTIQWLHLHHVTSDSAKRVHWLTPAPLSVTHRPLFVPYCSFLFCQFPLVS